jgi:hypothetical protein
MTCGCVEDGIGDGNAECSEAFAVIQNCRNVYGGGAADLVNGAELQRQLDRLAEGHNAQALALAILLETNCEIKDDIIRCRNLHPEVGVACLTGDRGSGGFLYYDGIDLSSDNVDLARVPMAAAEVVTSHATNQLRLWASPQKGDRIEVLNSDAATPAIVADNAGTPIVSIIQGGGSATLFYNGVAWKVF